MKNPRFYIKSATLVAVTAYKYEYGTNTEWFERKLLGYDVGYEDQMDCFNRSEFALEGLTEVSLSARGCTIRTSA